MSTKDYKLELRNQLVKFFDEIIEQFPRKPNFIIMRIFVKDQMSLDTLMNKFLKNVYPYKEKVKNKDEIIFQKMDGAMSRTLNRKGTFVKLWNSKQLDDDDRDILWKWMELFMNICYNYTKSLESKK